MTREPLDTVDMGATQRALLEAAISAGYFSVPRQTTLVDLADAHDISTREASRSLRTALQQVLVPLFDDTDEVANGVRYAEFAALFSEPERQPTGPATDLLFRALGAKQRRWVLYYLRQRSPVSREELTDILVGWQASESGPLGPDARSTVESMLAQVHLPLLESAGMVSYDEETVTLEPLTDDRAALLDAARYIDEAAPERSTPIPAPEDR